jgi:hypothetical protein
MPDPGETTYEICIELDGIDSPIWHTLTVLADITQAELHVVL